MGGKFGWFILGVVSGVALMAALHRARQQEELEDFESIADQLSKRFDELEKGVAS